MIYKCKCGQVHDNGINRRDFLGLGAGAIFGYALTHFVHPLEVVSAGSGFTPRGGYDNLVQIILNGGPSHSDLFDVKRSDKVPTRIRKAIWEDRMQIEPIPGTNFELPTGLLREIAAHADSMIINRVRYWDQSHERGQYWNYTAYDRNPAFRPERPNVGSVIAAEMARQGRRRETEVLPGFVQLNNPPGDFVYNGFLSGTFAPFTAAPNAGGLGAIITHPEGPNATEQRRRFEQDRYPLLMSLDRANRNANSPLGRPLDNMAAFYESGKKLMYNSVVDAFTFTVDERRRYHPTGDDNGSDIGNACIVAGKLLKANSGTRVVSVIKGGWDNHGNIYESLFGGNEATPTYKGNARQLSAAIGALISDLKDAPSTREGDGSEMTLYDRTLIVIVGDFGRTPADNNNYNRQTGLNNQNGRDHFETGFVVVFGGPGGGLKGGRAIGTTDGYGRNIQDGDYGWDAFAGPRFQNPGRPRTASGYPSAGPWLRLEDCYFGVYSALGIDPTYEYRGTPSGRPFELIYKKDKYFGEPPWWS